MPSLSSRRIRARRSPRLREPGRGRGSRGILLRRAAAASTSAAMKPRTKVLFFVVLALAALGMYAATLLKYG